VYKLVLAVAAGFFVFILWIIYLANTGGRSIFFDFIRSFPHGDKLGHIGLFGFLTLTAIIGLKFRSLGCGKFRIYIGAVLVSLFVVVEECSQAFIPSRTFDFADLAADFVGILLAIVVAYFVNKLLFSAASKPGDGKGT